MNILKKINLFGALEKMVQNLNFWTSPKLAIDLVFRLFFFRIFPFRKKYFHLNCNLEKKWPVDSLRQPILIIMRCTRIIDKYFRIPIFFDFSLIFLGTFKFLPFLFIFKLDSSNWKSTMKTSLKNMKHLASIERMINQLKKNQILLIKSYLFIN